MNWIEVSPGKWLNLGLAVDIHEFPADEEQGETVAVRLIWPAINEQLQVLDSIHVNGEAEVILGWLRRNGERFAGEASA